MVKVLKCKLLFLLMKKFVLCWILSFLFFPDVYSQISTTNHVILPEQDNLQWISIDSILQKENQWICFRKEIQVENRQDYVPMIIAADSKYWLWINGKLVVFEGALKRGPNPNDTYYDEIDIADYLKKKGINRFVVEVGGEIVASGRREEGALWRIGIDKPKEGNFFPGKFLQEVLLLEDAAMATSGNYRQFYLIEGKERVNHIINPKTGQNSKNTMLSATVIAPTCAEADAFATLFMVVGIDKSREILSRNPHLGAYLIYAEGDEDRVFITPDVVKRIKK